MESFDREDQKSRETMQSLRNWADCKAREVDDSERMRTLSQIRSTMKDFREALLFESTLASIATPDRRTLKASRLNFFHGRRDDPQSFPMLGGTSSSLYDDTNDLVALHDTADIDRLMMFVKDHSGFFFKDVVPQDGGSEVPMVGYASGRQVAAFVAYLSMILAVLLLFGAILILYKVESNDTKVGLVALFTVLFTASVGLLTNAKRPEVFGATAAYAAVLVVFYKRKCWWTRILKYDNNNM